MAQRLATAVRHPLASAASTPPQLPLGDESPRNNEELPLGDETLGTKRTKRRASPAGERGVIDAALASLGGRNPEAQFAGKRGNIGRPSFPWGTKPRGTTRWRARHHRRRPSLPWGTKPRGPKKSFPWGTKPRGQNKSFNKDNAQPSRVGSSKHKTKTKTKGTRTETPPKLQGCGKKENDNNKDDAQPPRLRRTNQASPPGCNFYVLIFMFSPTLLNIVRKKAVTGGIGKE